MAGTIKQQSVKNTVPGPRQDMGALFDKWGLYILLLITTIVYCRAGFNSFTTFDDNIFITGNPLVTGPGWEGIAKIFTTVNQGKYQPLITFTFLLEYRLFDFNPVVFHLTNVILHLASTWLLFKFARRLSGHFVAGFVVAALFALHPMHVEEVAWASELKDTLPTFFYLCALNYYLRYHDSAFRGKYLLYVFLFFCLSLLSKFSVLTMPLVLLAIDFYRARTMNKRLLLEKLPFVAIAIFFLVIGLRSQHSDGSLSTMPATYSLINRVFLFTYVPSFYIVKLIAPFHLSAMYYYPQLKDGLLPWYYYASLPFFAGVLWLVFRPSPYRRDLIFGLAFFFITIWFMEQIIFVGPSITPERYTYISYTGFFYVFGRWLSNEWLANGRSTIVYAFFSVLVLFSVRSWTRIAVWKDTDSILSDNIEKNEGHPDSFYPYYLLGKLRVDEGDMAAAMTNFNQSILLNPRYGPTYNNRGAIFFRAGDMKSALSDFDNALKFNPVENSVYNNIASLKATIGDFKGAITNYDNFLQLEPDNTRAYCDRGMVRVFMGDTAAGCADFTKSMKLGSHEAEMLLTQFCH